MTTLRDGHSILQAFLKGGNLFEGGPPADMVSLLRYGIEGTKFSPPNVLCKGLHFLSEIFGRVLLAQACVLMIAKYKLQDYYS